MIKDRSHTATGVIMKRIKPSIRARDYSVLNNSPANNHMWDCFIPFLNNILKHSFQVLALENNDESEQPSLGLSSSFSRSFLKRPNTPTFSCEKKWHSKLVFPNRESRFGSKTDAPSSDSSRNLQRTTPPAKASKRKLKNPTSTLRSHRLQM